MTPAEERAAIREILAKNRYAKCPDNFNKRRFAAIRADMECRYMTEWLATPSGLYTDSQIWSQCFNKN